MVVVWNCYQSEIGNVRWREWWEWESESQKARKVRWPEKAWLSATCSSRITTLNAFWRCAYDIRLCYFKSRGFVRFGTELLLFKDSWPEVCLGERHAYRLDGLNQAFSQWAGFTGYCPGSSKKVSRFIEIVTKLFVYSSNGVYKFGKFCHMLLFLKIKVPNSRWS